MNNNTHIKPYPLGISESGDCLKFSFAGGSAGQCTLNIYSNKNTRPLISVIMDKKDKTGDVFSCLVDKSVFNNESGNYYDYIYEIDGQSYIDPYAPQISGREVFGKHNKDIRGRINFRTSQINGNNRPSYDAHDLIIYQMHVRGFTKHRSSKVKHKGTYAGITEKIDHFQSLGINCLLLLPAYEFNEYINEPAPIGLPDYIEYEDTHRVNYWGYTDDAYYMAPKSAYASSPEKCTEEFSEMITKLHDKGIMVMLDMHFPVWAHSGYICDCLRNWVVNYHIDGFRVNQEAIDYNMINRDPVLSDIILLGNYWNQQYRPASTGLLGLIPPSGCQLAHCNDGFLVTIRRFIKGETNNVWDIINKIVEGGYNYHDIETVNYVASVNGLTLNDSVSYNRKHNEDNNENNCDGTDYNYSTNFGVEGKTRRKTITDKRQQAIRNELMLLMISSGIPMLLAGDEMYNSQEGNNNAYCQDNDISWLNWNCINKGTSLTEYIKTLTSFRSEYIIGDKRGYAAIAQKNEGSFPNISYHGREPWQVERYSYCRAGGVLISDKGLYIAINLQDDSYNFELPILNDTCIWKAACWSSLNPPKGFVLPPNSIAVFAREK